MLLFSLLSAVVAQPPASSAFAEAIGQANLRASASIDAALLGEIRAGLRYPIIGRSQLYPWLLLGDGEGGAPMGWVYETLVVVSGDISGAPFSEMAIDPRAPVVRTAAPAFQLPEASPVPASTSPTATPATGAFGVSGRVTGQVNIRYGPGVEYLRAGVAQAGEQFAVTGYHTQFPWLRIAYPGAASGQAWIARDLLELSGNVFDAPAISRLQFELPPLTPTPAMVRPSGINGGKPEALDGELQYLANELWNLLLERGFDPQTNRFGALFVMDLASGQAFSFGDDFAFSGTSLIKIGILAKLYEELGAPPTIELATDILNTMICSENAATNRLLRRIGDGDVYAGAEAVTELLWRLGLGRAFLTAPFVTVGTPEPPTRPIARPQTEADQVKAQPDLSNQLTVSEMGSLLANLYQCAYEESGILQERAPGIEARECRQMLHVMSNNTVDALLKSGAPAETRVAHKHGWIPDTHGNAALFFTPGSDYVIVMLLFQPSWLNFQESLPLFAEASRRVYQYFNPGLPRPAEREWHIPDANSCNYFGDPLIADLLQSSWDG